MIINKTGQKKLAQDIKGFTKILLDELDDRLPLLQKMDKKTLKSVQTADFDPIVIEAKTLLKSLTLRFGDLKNV